MSSSVASTIHPHDEDAIFTFDLSILVGYPLYIEIGSAASSTPFDWSSFGEHGLLAEGGFLTSPGVPLEVLNAESNGQFLEGIPDDILMLAKNVPFLDYALCQACLRFESAMELARSCPLLLLLAIDTAIRLQVSVGEFITWLSGKRTQLLEMAGLKGSRSLSRLMSKVIITPIVDWQLAEIKTALEDEENLKLLRHYSHPTFNHLQLLHLVEAPWPGLLDMVDASTRHQTVTLLVRFIQDVRRMAPNGTRLYRVHTQQELRELHDDLVGEFNGAASLERMEQLGDCPRPPIAGYGDIAPVDTWEALIAEGRKMHHCVASYSALIADGSSYIYRMASPEALTVEIRKSGTGWVLGEVRGYCNALPNDESLKVIHAWLALRKKTS